MDPVRTCKTCGNEIPTESLSEQCRNCLEATGLETMGAETIILEESKGDPVLGAEIFDELPGKYTLLNEHARGGMGRVLLVHDESLGRDVALKELLPGRGSSASPTPAEAEHSKELAARFLREARITGQLEHPSITPVHELGRRGDGSLYYTMKLVKGVTLQQKIRDCETLKDRLQLLPHFVDLCNAVAYAHSRNVIHRDIKPANVMVGEYGETVILDWGLAKVHDDDDTPRNVDPEAETVLGMKQNTPGAGHQTTAGQLLGTPIYMSPEQAKGLAADERSDIYSLGAVLYEILTGEPPFEGKNVQEIIAHVIHDAPIAPQKLEKRLQDELNRICLITLDKNPAKRYDSAKKLANTIDALKIRRRRSKALKYMRRAVAACILAVIVITPVLNWIYDERLQARYAQLEEDGIPVYYEDLQNFMLYGLDTVEDNPEVLPAARRDAVGSVFTLYQQYPISSNLSSPFGETMLKFTQRFQDPAPLNEDEEAKFRNFMAMNQPLLDDLYSIADSERVSRQTIEYMIRDIKNPYGLPVPNLITMRTMIRMMCLQARLHMLDYDYNAAARALVEAFDLAQQLDANPFLTTLMIKVAIHEIIFDTVIDIPLSAQLHGPTWEALFDRLYRYRPYLDCGDTMNREMNVHLWTIQNLKAGKLDNAFSGPNPWLVNTLFMMTTPFQFLYDNEEIMLIDLNRRQQLAYRKPFMEARDELTAIMGEVYETSELFHPITLVMFPNLDISAYNAIRSAQRRNLILLSMLARRHYAQSETTPESLDDLDYPRGDYIDQLPECLITGTPIQMRVDDNDFLLYSFGPDSDDDRAETEDERYEPDEEPEGDIIIRVPII